MTIVDDAQGVLAELDRQRSRLHRSAAVPDRGFLGSIQETRQSAVRVGRALLTNAAIYNPETGAFRPSQVTDDDMAINLGAELDRSVSAFEAAVPPAAEFESTDSAFRAFEVLAVTSLGYSHRVATKAVSFLPTLDRAHSMLRRNPMTPRIGRGVADLWDRIGSLQQSSQETPKAARRWLRLNSVALCLSILIEADGRLHEIMESPLISRPLAGPVAQLSQILAEIKGNYQEAKPVLD